MELVNKSIPFPPPPFLPPYLVEEAHFEVQCYQLRLGDLVASVGRRLQPVQRLLCVGFDALGEEKRIGANAGVRH